MQRGKKHHSTLLRNPYHQSAITALTYTQPHCNVCTALLLSVVLCWVDCCFDSCLLLGFAFSV